MPHALFLGSSLASIDRLDMLPIPPDIKAQKTGKSTKLPPMNILSKLGLRKIRQVSAKTSSHASEIELSDLPNTACARDLDEIGIGGPGPSTLSPIGWIGRGDGEDISFKGLDGVERSDNRREETDFEIAQREYEADVKSFDRIAWVDLHILHSTVSAAFFLSLRTASRNDRF